MELKYGSTFGGAGDEEVLGVFDTSMIMFWVSDFAENV